MARNWQYPRWRRLLMQSAMWGILAATVGLAALVDRHRTALTIIALGPEVDCDVLRMHLPENWAVQVDAIRPGMLTAVSPFDGHSQYLLFVTAAPPAGDGLLDKLLKQNASPPVRQSPEPPIQGHNLRTLPITAQSRRSEAIPFGTKGVSSGRTTGQLYEFENVIENDEGREVPVRRLTIASVILPAGPEVTVRLEHIVIGSEAMNDDEGDVDLVKRIAATVRQVAAVPESDRDAP